MKEYGTKRNFWIGDSSGDTFYAQVQDVQPILDHCKEARDIQTKNSRTKNWHKVCSVPTTLIEKWINEGKLTKDFYRDEEQGLRLTQLVNAEAPHFMCTEKDLGIKNTKIIT